MPTCVALLRGINVGGHKPVAMADLRAVLARLGFEDARSLLQSGNLVFRSGPRSAAQLERSLETEVAKCLAIETDFFVRTADEWKRIVARNPFTAEARRDPGRLVVVFLKEAPAVEGVGVLQAAIKDQEIARVSGKQLYLVYPNGIGRSKLTTVLIERTLRTRGTARNWNTILKLAAAAGV